MNITVNGVTFTACTPDQIRGVAAWANANGVHLTRQDDPTATRCGQSGPDVQLTEDVVAVTCSRCYALAR